MQAGSHLLVIRFSALGDVAMTVPVLRNLLHQYPQLEVTVLSLPFVEPLFAGIDRLHFYGVDVRQDYKGLTGIYRLGKKIKRDIPYTAIADLHDVLRTKWLRFLLRGKCAVIDKGRAEKKELTRRLHKQMHPLKTGFQRYADVFAQLGYPVNLNKEAGLYHPVVNTQLLPVQHLNAVWIGLAPFAKHDAKMYPLAKMEAVKNLLLQNEELHICVFASAAEAATISHWQKEGGRLFIVAGKYRLADELNLMAQMRLMISMDSANMHLASLLGIPVISIWGGTHPWLGFYGWGQDMDNAIQQDLPCRPSSVFGNKACPVHGNAGCMQGISAQMIAEKVRAVLPLP